MNARAFRQVVQFGFCKNVTFFLGFLGFFVVLAALLAAFFIDSLPEIRAYILLSPLSPATL